MVVLAVRRMKAEAGADLSPWRRLKGHTATQPSSVEEEGYIS